LAGVNTKGGYKEYGIVIILKPTLKYTKLYFVKIKVLIYNT